jgi:hypothetical protein
MRKILIAVAATAVIGAVALKPSPASAFFWVPIVLEAKKDKNFKAVNPYAPKKAAAKKGGKKKKM